MNLQDVFNFIQFWVNKFTGSYFTVAEIEDVLDAGQMAYYRDLKSRYATSQYIKDALSPFREVYNFTTLVSGYVIVPNTNYLDLLDIQVYFQVSDRRVYSPVQLVNEDERANRLNSFIDPVTITSPVGEQTAPRTFRLYPAAAYNGNVTYLRRPVKPVFGYSVISGRVIVYNPNTSVQLEWRESDYIPLMLKGLESIGINLSSADITQWSDVKSKNNFDGYNRL